ncbi:MAG: integrase family protein [Chthoniobacteraceae bacterium]|nr:integrase family protein [Chthoniobacteraceae bacterium]
MLKAADMHDPQLLPFVAIGLFAGVRVYELMQLDWKHVDLIEGSIDLPASITKRERRRSVPITPTLRAWLEHYISKHGIGNGFVLPFRTYNTLRRHLRELFKQAKVRWQQNAARHSYASYWLAEHNDLTKLALYMGHVGGLEVLHMHYHRAVKKADAAKFWAIAPKSEASKVVSIEAAG